MQALLIAALLAAASPARAPDEGGAMVLRIDGRDAYFDLGREAGAANGGRVRLFRMVSALSPRTGATVRDRFLIAAVEISEAGAVLSRARLDPEVAAQVHVGDRVELERAVPVAFVPPPRPSRGPPTASATPPDQEQRVVTASPAPGPAAPTAEQREALEFRDAFVRAQQMSAPVRAAFWGKWAQAHNGPLAEAVVQEVEVLRAPLLASAAPPPPPEPPRPVKPVISAPTHAFSDDPVEVVLTYPGATPEVAMLNWRPRGARLFETVRFAIDGPHTLRASLPQSAAQPPGLDWWAGVANGGAERPVAGNGEAPHAVAIQNVPGLDVPPRKDRSRAGLWIDYADWNRFKGNDWFVDVEGEFLYRVLSSLHSLRMGFGLYQGQGQSLQSAVDDERQHRPYQSAALGFHYGYTELEFHPYEMFGVLGKLLTGVDRRGFAGGFEGRVRIGREDGTNLVLASGFTNGIGNKNEITLSWDRVAGWPMAGSVIVTNEPVMTDYGVRFLYTVGRGVTDFLDLSLRLSYQLRDINHNGFGAGLAGSFHW